MKRNLIFLLSISILNIGCSSFYNVNNSDIQTIKQAEELKLVLQNEEEIIVEDDFDIEINGNDTTFSYLKDSLTMQLNFSEIDNILIKKNDPTKTIFATFWIALGSALAIVVIFDIDFTQ